MERRATYMVEVPIRFTYSAYNDLDIDELSRSAENELENRLINGRFEVLTNKLNVTKTGVHFTREEKRAQEKEWEEIVSLVIGEEKPKKVSIFAKIFKGDYK